MDAVNFNFKEWSIKPIERKRGRMKLVIKLSKNETLAYKNFSEVVKPDAFSDEDFLRAVFLNGMKAMQEELVKEVKKYHDEHPEEFKEMLEKENVDMVEFADVSGSPALVSEATTSVSGN